MYLYNLTGEPPQKQILAYAGKVLQDGSLIDYNIRNWSMLSMVLVLMGGGDNFHIFIKTLTKLMPEIIILVNPRMMIE